MKWMLIILVFLPSFAGAEESPFPIPRKTAEPSEVEQRSIRDGGGKPVEGGLHEIVYRVPPTLRQPGRTAREMFEKAGIDFSKEGSSAEFVRKIRPGAEELRLKVRLPQEQLELVEAYLEPGFRPAKVRQIFVRIEIYEVAAPVALEIENSCEGRADHTAERTALREMVASETAKLEYLTNLMVGSGLRARVRSIGEGVEHPRAELEADAILGADGESVDLKLSFSYSTGEFPNGVSHRKAVAANLTTVDRNVCLIGRWRPSGGPGGDKANLTHLVFVQPSVQQIDR